MIDQAFEIFGRPAFGDNLFANNETAIRFELALGETRIERFDTALHRASIVAKDVFQNSKHLNVCLMFYGESFVSAKRSFRTLKECEVKINRPYFIEQEEIDDDFDGGTLTRVFFKSDLDSVYRMIWGTVALELGVHPNFGFRLYIFDSDQRILMHPYDDRGMDVLGPNQERMSEVYSKYHDWLLDYNIVEMNKRYGPK